MGEFGLDLSHIQLERLEKGDLLHQYFLLDLGLVLVDSIDQVRANRTGSTLGRSALSSSGGEEVSRILEEARTKYGGITRQEKVQGEAIRQEKVNKQKKVQGFRQGLDQADISFIPPHTSTEKLVPQVLHQLPVDTSTSHSSETKDSTDQVVTKAQPKPKRRKLSKEAARRKKEDKAKQKENILDTIDAEEKEKEEAKEEEEDDHEIAVNIPISDTTDVRIKVKPLDSTDLRPQRIHVRVNQGSPGARGRSRSKHITYGTKNVISHHLRKTRPPLFSRKPVTPKLDRKQVIEKVVNEVKKERDRRKEDEKGGEKEEEEANKPKLDFNIRANKILREKRTKNAQFRKMMAKLQ